jgi:hypothetical protein
MDRVETAAEKSDIHSDNSLPALACNAPLVSSFAGPVGKSFCKTMFLYRFLRLRCEQSASFSTLPPGCAGQVYLWPLCRQQTAVGLA